MDIRTTNTGFTEKVKIYEDRIPEYDPRSGNHFWVMISVYKCNPKALSQGEQAILDHENLVSVNGPGCYYCGEEYSTLVDSRRCKNNA